MIGSCPANKSGRNLFEKTPSARRFAPNINLGSTGENALGVISQDCFDQIKAHLHHAFWGSVDEDKWNAIRPLIDGFNENRRRTVESSNRKVVDECMSAFQPRTTAYSLLPHLTFVLRKPKPLGTELKVRESCLLACSSSNVPSPFLFLCFSQAMGDAEIGCLTFLEIQEGKEPMRKLKFTSEAGSVTAATTLQLIEGCEKEALGGGDRYVLCADSWFGSVRMVEALKCVWSVPKLSTPVDPRNYSLEVDKVKGYNPNSPEVVCAIKTNNGFFPYDELLEEMKEYPSGSYLVLGCTAPATNVELRAIGYKYNTTKVLLFLMSKNAGTTVPGQPYVARFPNEHGNVRKRRVPRLSCLSKYFGCANVIDVHNQYRQNLLALEEMWKTPNPWFCLMTTVIGMTVVDCFLAAKHHRGQLLPTQTLKQFADALAWDLTNNPLRDDALVPAIQTRSNISPAVSTSELDGQQLGGLLGALGLHQQATVSPEVSHILRQLVMNTTNETPTTGARRVSPSDSSLGGDDVFCFPCSPTDDIENTTTNNNTTTTTTDNNNNNTSTTTNNNNSMRGGRQEDHFQVPFDETTTESNGRVRPCNRRCVVYGTTTRMMCAHPQCRATIKYCKVPGDQRASRSGPVSRQHSSPSSATLVHRGSSSEYVPIDRQDNNEGCFYSSQ